MQVANMVAVVTGGANGIGRALCRRFAAEGAKAVVVADLKGAEAAAVAKEIGGMAAQLDVANESSIQALVRRVMDEYGCIDLFCSNAGIGTGGGEEAPDEVWERSWRVHVMAHVYAARAVVPAMLARSEGCLLQTVSAAGLLTNIGTAPYSVTKHAALAFAEWMAITYGDQGLKVFALCPQGVRTDMLTKGFLLDGAVEPEQVADAVIHGLAEERFLILPHPEVAQYFRNKANDYDRWLKGMRRLRAVQQPTKPTV